MTVESASDRLAMLNTDEFGVSVVYGEATIHAIWLTESDQFGPGDTQITSSRPACLVRTADVPNLSTSTHPMMLKTLTYDGATWLIVRWSHDGTGMTMLYLERSV